MTYPRRMITKTAFTPTGPSAYGSAPGIWRMDEAAYWQKQGLWPNPSIIPDTYFPYVSLLLSSTSLSNANNNLFVDSSGAFNPISRNGNTTQGSFTPYGSNWSNYFDGSGDYERIASNETALQFGTGAFTIEGWVYSAGGTGTYQHILTGGTSWTSGSGGVYWYYNGGSPYIGAAWNGFAAPIQSGTLSINTWYHFALVRSSDTLTLYVNGSSVSTLNVSGYSLAINNQNRTNVGGGGWDQDYAGYLSNLRAIKGTALYTSNFTVPSAPLTAVSGTSLLICQSNRFVDSSSNAFAMLVGGDTKVQKFSPFSPAYPGASYSQSDITNWSGFFDGTGDYLSVANSSANNLGTNDFTIELWFQSNTGTMNTHACLVASYSSPTSGSWAFKAQSGTSGYIEFASYGPSWNDWVTTTNIASDRQWHHCAVTRSGNTLRIFVDGTVRGTWDISGASSFTGGGHPLTTGFMAQDSTSYLNGNLSNVRIVQGTALYTSNFTPPTSALTAISGTVYLTCQNPAFTDNSTNNLVITQNGNPTVTGNSPFNTTGYWSNYFDGTGDYLTAPSNAAFAFGTGDYTVEAWVYPTSIRNGENLIYVTDVTQGMAFGYNQTQIYIGARATAYDLMATYTMPTNQWVHVAATRQSGTARIFVNGTQVGTGTITRSCPQGPGAVGDYPGVNEGVMGYLSNVRVVKGTALYTSNFTAPTAPLTAVSGTSLLTCQNGRFIDNSTNAFTITVNGNVAVQSFDPFYTATIASNGGSMYFDGSGDYLALQNNPSYALGSGDFTLDMWVYPITQGGHGSGNNDCLMDFRPGSNGAYGTFYIYNSGASVNWYANTANQITGGAIKNGAWSHLCVSRVSGSTRLFINGVQSGSTYADSTNYLQTNPWIGQFNDGPGGGYFNGYMLGPRIVKGSGVSSTFTPPTTPVTPTAATTLLLNGMNAGIYDATTINDMETVGNAQVRYPSPYAPANYWAGAFNGSNAYLTSATSSAYAMGTGDFTIEGWFFTTASADQGLWDNRSSSTSASGIGCRLLTSSNTLRVILNNTALFTTSTAVTLNQWNHIAVVRSSGTVTAYLNGTAMTGGSASGTTNITDTNMWIGKLQDAGYFYNGYVSNFRVVKGTAVYTANFTPSTTPLTAISGTSLLTCQNKTFIDNSTNAFTITANGSASAGAIGPFPDAASGTSMYFDGSGDYLNAGTNPAFAFGTAPYTVEAWVYVTGSNTENNLVCNDTTNGFDLYFNYSSNTTRLEYRGGSNIIAFNAVPTRNTWAHVALVREGTGANQTKFYLNGVSQGSGTDAVNWTISGPMLIGGIAGAAYYSGYIDDLRITKGVARYTANFTPPTQAFPVY